MKKILISIIVVLLIIGAAGVFAITLRQSLIAPPQDTEIQVPPTQTDHPTLIPSSLPSRLIIPSLGINANVQKVGISKRGTMAVPTNFTDVGWYKYGPIPGEKGSAVIAGHLDNGLGMPGVFKHLSDLKPGDEIIVEDVQGNRFHFTVTQTGTMGATAMDTAAVFNSSSTSANLNLITCEGTWQPQARMYSLRRVVFTTLSRTETSNQTPNQ